MKRTIISFQESFSLALRSCNFLWWVISFYFELITLWSSIVWMRNNQQWLRCPCIQRVHLLEFMWGDTFISQSGSLSGLSSLFLFRRPAVNQTIWQLRAYFLSCMSLNFCNRRWRVSPILGSDSLPPNTNLALLLSFPQSVRAVICKIRALLGSKAYRIPDPSENSLNISDGKHGSRWESWEWFPGKDIPCPYGYWFVCLLEFNR